MINNSNPIIIIGMHRSGTSMLSRILHEYGIFFGLNVEGNNESIPYLRCNEQIFKKNNSDWFNVGELKGNILKSKESSIQIAKKALEDSFKDEYFENLNDNSLADFDNWGWKDPRNTYTVDIWREIYPEAKVIHIYRNPIDVAISLRNREIKFDNSSTLSWIYHTQKFKFKHGFYVSRCPSLKNLENGYKLWESYVREALSKKDILNIKYEDLITNEKFELYKIFNFLQIKRDEKYLKSRNFKIDNSRKFNFCEDPDSCRFYNSIKKDELINRLGYQNII